MTQGELAIAASFLDSTLRGDSTIMAYVTGGIWLDAAEEGTQAPYIVLLNKTSNDLMVVNQDRVWTDMTFDVQLVVPGNDIITPDPVYLRIDQLLHKGGGSTAGGQVIACTRLRTDTGNSLAAGVEYRHMVQTYSLLVQRT